MNRIPLTQDDITWSIYLSDKDVMWCLTCNRMLQTGEVIIPDGETKRRRYTGKVCPKCKSAYMEKSVEVENFLSRNYYDAVYTLHGSTQWKYSWAELMQEARNKRLTFPELMRKKERERKSGNNPDLYRANQEKYRERLKKVKTSAFSIVVQDQNEAEADIIIVHSRAYEDRKDRILYFMDPGARKLMTLAFHDEKKGRWYSLNGKKYTVTDVVYPENTESKGIVIPKVIVLRKNGGYYSPKDPDAVIVVAMIYSPFTGSYEPLRVTYDPAQNVYYTDPQRFRDYLYKNGNPELPLRIYNSGTSRYGFWGELSEESFLKGYGYSVSEQDAIPRSTRQDMLSELVDLGIASVSDIVRHLNNCIRLHSTNKDRFAREKWNEDIEFISDYKADPERFLIAPGIQSR